MQVCEAIHAGRNPSLEGKVSLLEGKVRRGNSRLVVNGEGFFQMRRTGAFLTAVLVLSSLISISMPTTAGAQAAKLSPELAAVLEHGGYPNQALVPKVVPNYRAGDIYYLAEVAGDLGAGIEAIRSTGARVTFEYPAINWVAVVSTVDQLARVSGLDRVSRLEADKVQEVHAVNAQVASDPWTAQAKRGTSDIGADVLWRQGVTGKGVTVGVADSGMDSTHPDLDDLDWLKWTAPGNPAKIDSFVDCTAVLPFTEGSCAPGQGYDDNGHGTHVSGIATGTAEGGLPGQNGRLPGVAPDAKLAGAKVCLAAGSCLNSSVLAGLQYLATEKADGGGGADVINVSLGSGRFYGAGLFAAEQVTNNDPEAQLVNALAVANNVVFTISAGNSGPVFQSLGSPSVASQAVSVGAAITDFDLNHPVEETEHGEFGNIRPAASSAGATAIASFSSRAPSGDRLIKPELTAPGSYYVAAESAQGAEVKAADAAHNNKYSADPFYAVLSGTSMSAPAAAGAAALVIDGYRQSTGSAPDYYRVKAALANTAGTRAFEGPVAGLLGTIQSKVTDTDPNELYPIRNQDWVGVTGEGAGRIYAPSALLALTKGVIAYTPQVGELDDINELQPNWAVDDVAAGESVTQQFVLRGAPGMTRVASTSFSVESGKEPIGAKAAPANWLLTPRTVKAVPNGDTPFKLGLRVPRTAAPGMYSATVVANSRIADRVTQRVRIPVQFFVTIADTTAGAGGGASIEGPIWASGVTDYTYAGLQADDILTDWAMYPVRLTSATEQVDFSVYDVGGTDHMDVFVFDDNGQEVDSTVSFRSEHFAPGGALYFPTSSDAPETVSILDGDDLIDVALPTTVWVAVSNSGPAESGPGFSTYHLDVDVTAGAQSPGTTPAERIHSGAHAWWGGSMPDADSTLTQTYDLSGVTPGQNPKLSFWTWYQLEDGFDWAYVLASTDGGQTWTSLQTQAANGSGTTTLDPIGDSGGVLGGSKAYPNGITGTSGQSPMFTGQNLLAATYTEHTADLTPYAGKSVLIRFAYTSDPGTNYEGFYVDDIAVVDGAGAALAVGAINPDDAETQSGWVAGGTPGFTWMTADQ
jgi:subtilisin family serine protease